MIKTKFVLTVSMVAFMAVGVAHADIASTTYYKGTAPVSVSNGTISVANATADAAGVTKVYTSTGSSTDGTMTRKAITEALAGKLSTTGKAASATIADSATKATQDADGNVIKSTYATKTELAGKLANTSTIKNAIVTTDANGTVAPVEIVDSGTGTYVTDVAVSAGKVTLSRGTPSIPTVNNATLTIQKNGTTVDTFTANASTNKTINITVPTGALASKSAVASADITDGTIVNADISASAAIAQSKIANLTTDLAAKEATANKLTSTATTTVSDTNKDTLYPSVGKVQSMINALDVSDSAESGKYVSAVSETDGKISVTRASLPTVNNATLTIQKNGTTVDTFTANASANKTINITVPTKVSELTNDSNYATTSAVEAKVTTAQGSTNANKAVITNSSGSITTGTIATGMITDLNVTTAKIAASAVTTAKIADSAVTAAKTSGVIGSIPSGSATSTTYATIWVQ